MMCDDICPLASLALSNDSNPLVFKFSCVKPSTFAFELLCVCVLIGVLSCLRVWSSMPHGNLED